MEELLEKIKDEIKIIKKQQSKVEKLTEKSANLQEEEKKSQEELDTIKDANSGFYQDAKKELDEKHYEFVMTDNERRNEEKELDKLIAEKKAKIRQEIADKKNYVDENRNVKLVEDIGRLKAEKERLDKEIELNNVTKEEFDKKSDSEKKEIRKAKENYLHNKNRLAEINPMIELTDFLNGLSPKQKFIELDELDRKVEANFNKNELDNITREYDEKLLEEMVSGRDKREEERYYEDVKSGLEETQKRKDEEKQKEDEELLEEMVAGREKREEERYYEDVKSGLQETEKRKLEEQGLIDEKGRATTQSQTSTSQNQTTQTSDKIKPIDIQIGRRGLIDYDGTEYEVSARDIKYGLSLNSLEDKELKEYLRQELRVKENKLDALKDLVREGSFDMTVIHAVYSSDMPKKQKSEILNQYVAKIQYSKANVKNQNKLDIQYDMEDLSKAGLFSRIFRQEVNTDEKLQMYNNAIKAERYEIGKIHGEYKPSRLENFFRKLTGREETAKFPIYKEEDVIDAAYAYNEMAYDKDGNKLKKKEVVKSFKEMLRANAELDNELDEEAKGQLTDEQLREVKNLVKAHKDPVKTVEEEQEK